LADIVGVESDAFAFLRWEGEMARLIRDHDWSKSLGPIADWPSSLKTTVGLLIRSPVPLVLLWGEDGIMIYNDAYSVFAGGRHPSLLGSKVREGWPEVADFNDNVMRVGLAGGTLAYKDQELTLYRTGAPEQVWMNLDYSPVIDESGQPGGVIAIVVETTPKVKADLALRESERRLRFLDDLGQEIAKLEDADAILATTTRMVGEHLGIAICAYADMDEDEDGFTIRGDWSAPESRSIVGRYRLADFGKLALQELGAGRPLIINDNLREIAPEEAATFQNIGIAATICMPLVKEGRLTALMAIHHKVPHVWTPYELAVIREVTERSWAHVERVGVEAELRELNVTLERRVEERTAELVEAQNALRQIQKMEAVGQLTGGIAHDFNNLLTGITGSLEMLERRLDDQDPAIHRYINAAQGAARRAAALTQRLLAFSRRATLDPRPIDANRLIAGIEDLIRRTMGPDITVEVGAGQGLWITRVDPAQLESVLLNLCINARDAMAPGGGLLTIQTSNRSLDERSSKEWELPPGEYVSLCVTDTGCGMTPAVMERAFDPFFTTKPIGAGTGLGLSMAYGFARQSGGQIRIHSEPGEGAAVSLFLPRFDGEAERLEEPAASAVNQVRTGRGEVVLVVDDDPVVRMLVVDVLKERGYSPLAAGDGASGLAMLQSAQHVELLVTDVGLPNGMNGRQVAEAARQLRPGLKVLFVTGYAENAVVGNGQLDPGMELMTKPFNTAALGDKIQAILGRR
jgi:signal transduction histidine kinase/ActR/RegA family two-component response regulator